MTKERLEQILKEKENDFEKFKVNAHLYFDELLCACTRDSKKEEVKKEAPKKPEPKKHALPPKAKVAKRK